MMHRGTGMNIVPEMDVREVIINGLHELANDREAIEGMVSRTDALRDGSQDDWTAELRAELLAMLDPESDRYVYVKVGYPLSNAHLPCVSIILEGATENQGEANIGDDLNRYTEVQGTFVAPVSLDNGLSLAPLPNATTTPTPVRVEEVQVKGTGWSSNVQCGCWHVAPEGALLLQAAVRWALFRGKGQLHDAGVHQLSFSEGGVQPDGQMEPRVGYVPMITIHMDWTYRQIRRKTVMPGNIAFTTTYSC